MIEERDLLLEVTHSENFKKAPPAPKKPRMLRFMVSLEQKPRSCFSCRVMLWGNVTHMPKHPFVFLSSVFRGASYIQNPHVFVWVSTFRRAEILKQVSFRLEQRIPKTHLARLNNTSL